MTIGFGYHQEKHLENLDESKYGASSLTRRAYDADFAFEKMFYKKYLIGAELGYMYFKDTHLYQDLNTYKKGDMWTWYGEAHLIYAEKVGIGFPGIGFRYEYVETDGKFEDSKTGEIFKDLSYDRYGVCLSYYLRKTKRGIDVTNRFGIGFDYVKARDALKEYIKRKDQDDSNFTWYAAVYFNF